MKGNGDKPHRFISLHFAWYYAVFLVAAVALGHFGDFRPEPQTVEVWLEDDFTADEEARVIGAVEEWNRAVGPLAGREVLVYRGRVNDPDGYRPADADDDRHVIYRRTEKFREGGCANCVGQSLVGEDIELYPNRLDDPPSMFDVTALHELGHLLVNGAHNRAPGSIMFDELFTAVPKITPFDQAYYCESIKCR